MNQIDFINLRAYEENEILLTELRKKIEDQINLNKKTDELRHASITKNLSQRIALLVGLSLRGSRNLETIKEMKFKSSNHLHDTVFSKNGLNTFYSAMLKLRYNDYSINWSDTTLKSKIINHEIKCGAEYLLKTGSLEDFLFFEDSTVFGSDRGDIPEIKITLGSFEGDIPAYLDMNSVEIPNSQVVIAGSTGSGKSNLLAVIISEFRNATIESSYPVNFLLFDYKGEFSNPVNREWLKLFEVDESVLYNPVKSPLPFNPFKDFTGKPQNEVNLYATELAEALSALDRARISANMSNRLSEAVINAYSKTGMKPVNFELILQEYTFRQSSKDAANTDSVKSILNQLIRTNLFSDDDSLNLVSNSMIIDLSSFPKDGPIAKAIVYFTVSNLNNLYETAEIQKKDDKFVQIRHFTIIDEAHYMLDFDNKPLKQLIAVGRNKGFSIILATQNMDSFKSPHFDFYANAEYPLILKQQSMNDKVIKDLFGVSGKEFNEIKEAISQLQKGELILKNPLAYKMEIGSRYKKVKVNHLI